ncbi:DEAD/DEAH box helicase [Streptomyces sp. MMBL 11-3]|uniref:DEAD/DEAH box helicase n=1 Tax=Streptomyces sp. MMBL 11-3 TaxID=3382639 RepID=UPI0039B55EB1
MTLPVALAGNDVIGQAKTGTGKTLGFGLPLLERVTVPADVEAGRAQPEQLTDAPQALVVVPTRELCTQVTNDLLTAGKVRNVRVLAIYGGRAYEPQVEALKKGIDVVVGTPGRLLDLAGQKKLNLKHVRALVLDEADEMLDLGFLPDVEKIMNMLPVRRQTMLFSATMPGAVIGLARRYMSQPTHIRAAEPDDVGATVANTKQHIYRAHNMDKPEMVARILQADGRGLAMVFCRTKRTAADLADQLQQRGFASGAVHGDLGQGAREQALRAFRNGKVDVLVCTDVAARGIDVEGVTHVINYQSPEDEKTYLHRIGRTGRAGAKGIAITLVDWDDIPRWQLINKALNLGFNDPPETYSTSPHLFEELSIPAGTKGVLPRSERTRAGLSAEVVEDLGETGGRGARGGGRGGRSAAPAADRDRDRDRERERSARTPRRRRRTRNGAALDAAEPQTAAQAPAQVPSESAAPAAAAEPRTPRRRRRTRAGGAFSEEAATAVVASEGTVVEAPVVEVTAPAPVPATEPVTDTEARPRRRRSRRSAEAAQPVVVVVEEAPSAEPAGPSEVAGTVEVAEAVVTKPRRRTRKAAPAETAVDTAEGTAVVAPEVAQVPEAVEVVETKPRRRTRKAAVAPEVAEAVVDAVVDPVEAVEAKPRRTRKTAAKATTTDAAEAVLDAAEAVEAKPRRRTRKAAAAPEAAEVTAVAEAGIPAQATEEPEAKPRRRTRKTAETVPAAAVTPVEEASVAQAAPRRRTRKATAPAETAVDTAEGATVEAPSDAAPAKPRRTRKAAAPAEGAQSAVDTAEGTEAKPRRRTRKVAVAEADIPAQAGEAAADTAEAPAKPRRTRKTAAKATTAEAAVDAGTAEAAPKAAPRRRARKTAAPAEPTEG